MQQAQQQHPRTATKHPNKKQAMQNLSAWLIALSTIWFALAMPEVCKAAILAGYAICVDQLLFALFPFFVAASLLVRCGVAPLVGRPLQPLCRLLGFAEPCAAGIFAIALLGGFAPAITALNQAVQQGEISKARAEKLLPLVCFLGPSYTILAIGQGLLGNPRVGVYLFVSQVLAAVGCAAALRLLCGRSNKNKTEYRINKTKKQPRAAWSLSNVIGDSFFAFLRLCGVVLYFQFLAAGIGALLPESFVWLSDTCLEVTRACARITAIGTNASVRCCAALSLLSVSILLQAKSLCTEQISLRYLLLSRALHLAIALFFFRLLLQIPQTQAVYSSLSERVIAIPRLPLEQALLLFIALVCLADRLRMTFAK